MWKAVRKHFAIAVVIQICVGLPLALFAQSWSTPPASWAHGYLVSETDMNAYLLSNTAYLYNHITALEVTTPPTEYNGGNTDGGKNVDWNAHGSAQHLVRNDNTVLTMFPPAYAGTVRLKLIHDGTGTAYTVGFSPTVKWPGGSAPSWTNTAGAIDLVTLYWDGTSWFGWVQNAFA